MNPKVIPKNIWIISPLISPKKKEVITKIKTMNSISLGIFTEYFFVIDGMKITINNKRFMKRILHNLKYIAYAIERIKMILTIDEIEVLAFSE